MSSKLVCNVCGNTTSSFFMVVGPEAICSECKGKHKSKYKPQYQKPQIFKRYICTTHDCGTYNVNNMMHRHVMKVCEIKTQFTLGIIRPATYGGYNGDIGREHFLDINEMARLINNLENYKRFIRTHYKLDRPRPKISYSEKKYYNKHLKFLRIGSNIDFHRFDSLLLKLKFNLNNYIEAHELQYKERGLTSKERNNLYYKNLMQDFKTQVIKR